MMTAVVILDYKVPELLKSCIEALPDSVEVIIVDNNTTNRGFAAGCNLGIKQAIERGADYVWLLNNDAIVRPDTLENLLACVAPGIGAVGSVVLNPDGSVQVWGGGYVRLGRSRRLRSPGPYSWLSACSLLLTREAIVATGGFDEGFFMYWEDVDLSFRLTTAGYGLAVARDAFVTHFGGSEVRHSPRSLIRFFKKHSAFWPIHVFVAALLGIKSRIRWPELKRREAKA
jgi:GT2 family glycosyltransferase